MVGYPAMQSSIDTGYLAIAGEEQAALAPVGFAWMAMEVQAASPTLWQDDGSHPTTSGTYLAACVFYATIFGQSPVDLSYHAGLSDGDAAIVQAMAASTVLADQPQWHLPLAAASPAA